MNVVSIIALTILISLLQIGCSPVSVSLNSEFGLSLGKTPAEEEPSNPIEITVSNQPPYLNAANAAAYLLSGTCKNIEFIQIKINNVPQSKIACNSEQWQATLDSSAEADGTVTIELINPETKASLKTLSLEKDIVPPVAVSDVIMPALTNISDTMVSITENLGSTYYSYKIGAPVNTDCSSPTGYSTYMTAATDVLVENQPDGLYRLCLVGKDSFENEQAYNSATILNWEIDTVAPVLSLVSASSNSYIFADNKAAFTVNVSCSDPGGPVKFFAIDKDALELSSIVTCAANNTATYSFNTTTFADGNVNFYVVHKDAAGNSTGNVLILTVVKDVVPPVISSLNDGSYYASITTSPTLTWTAATDAGGSGVNRYEIGFGTSNVSPNTSAYLSVGLSTTTQKTFGSNLTEGTLYYTFLKAYDNAGNHALLVSDGWKPDVTAPAVASINDGVHSAVGATPNLTWTTGTDSIAGINRYEVAIGTSPGSADVMSWTTAGTSTSFSGLVPGIHIGNTYYASVHAVDNAGNYSAVTMGDGFYVKPAVQNNSIVSNYGAFAAIMTNGKVICWGDSGYGGDYADLPTALKSGPLSAVKLFSNQRAFAALMNNGSVITWGSSADGGDSSAVASALDGTIDVTAIAATSFAFAAKLVNGSVVAWGAPGYGGTIPNPTLPALDGTVGVVNLFSNSYAFAAVRTDGSVIAWGGNGGDTSAVSSDLDGTIPVTAIYSTSGSFIAKRNNGSLVAWGNFSTGIQPSAVAPNIDGSIPVVTVVTNSSSAAAIRSDGSVITWGSSIYGGDSSMVATEINGTNPVIKIFANTAAFSALRSDGTVITWGAGTSGGNSSTVASELIGVTHIANTSSAFAAVRANGSAIIWGSAGTGGSLGVLPATAIDGTNPVTAIYGNHQSFAAIRNDGSLVAWGNATSGGDTGSVASKLDGVVNDVVYVHGGIFAFAAVLSNGELVTWGDPFVGGDSSAVNP